MLDVRIGNNNNRVGGWGSLTLEMTAAHKIEKDGEIEVVFPKWDDDENESYLDIGTAASPG